MRASLLNSLIPTSYTPIVYRCIRFASWNRVSKAEMSSTVQPGPSILFKNTAINEGPGVSLNVQQKLLVSSVLDLFEGNPTLKHLALWHPTATFRDPIALAKGYSHYAAQWYGLAALFSPIQIQSHCVTSADNPIEISLSNKYTAKGTSVEHVIDSIVRIHVAPDGRIEEVEDRWNDILPEGAFSQIFRKLNANIVSSLVTVPKTEEEDEQMRADRTG